MMLLNVLVVIAAFTATCYSAVCPPKTEGYKYELILKRKHYEVRQLPATVWATIASNTDDEAYEVAKFSMFQKLLGYFFGENREEISLNVSTTVRVKVITCGESALLPITLKMSFLIPLPFAENPPIPLDTEIYIVKEPPTSYAVRTFGGKASEIDWAVEAHRLSTATVFDNTVLKPDYYTVWFHNQYASDKIENEVWLQRKSEIKDLATESNSGRALVRSLDDNPYPRQRVSARFLDDSYTSPRKPKNNTGRVRLLDDYLNTRPK